MKTLIMTFSYKLYADYDVIVNCVGLGAAKLVKDEQIVPYRGQVIRVYINCIFLFLKNINWSKITKINRTQTHTNILKHTHTPEIY